MENSLTLDEMLAVVQEVPEWNFLLGMGDSPPIYGIVGDYTVSISAHREKQGDSLFAEEVEKGHLRVSTLIEGRDITLGDYVDEQYQGGIWLLYKDVIDEEAHRKEELYVNAINQFRRKF